MGAQVGKKAPDFTARAVVGGAVGKVSLAQNQDAGKWTVLFFYPLDFTSVCSSEIWAFNHFLKQFRQANAIVWGVSCDSTRAHEAWINGELGEMGFPLVSDATHSISRDYGVLSEEDGFALRAVFIIDPDGVIMHSQVNQIDVAPNVSEIHRLVRAFQTGDDCPAGWEPGDPIAQPRATEEVAVATPTAEPEVEPEEPPVAPVATENPAQLAGDMPEPVTIDLPTPVMEVDAAPQAEVPQVDQEETKAESSVADLWESASRAEPETSTASQPPVAQDALVPEEAPAGFGIRDGRGVTLEQIGGHVEPPKSEEVWDDLVSEARRTQEGLKAEIEHEKKEELWTNLVKDARITQEVARDEIVMDERREKLWDNLVRESRITKEIVDVSEGKSKLLPESESSQLKDVIANLIPETRPEADNESSPDSS